MMDPVEPAPEPVLETEEVETEEMMRHRVEQEERARMEEGLEELRACENKRGAGGGT